MKIIGIIKSGVIAKNLKRPGAWANPTAVKTFLNDTLVCLSGNSFTPITKIKTAIGVSGLTAILTWLVWSIFIFVIGVKIFPDKETKVPFKKILIAVGYAHAPGLVRFFAVTPEFVIPIIFLTQFWIFASLIVATKQILNLKSNFKAFGIVFLSFLIIAFLSISFVMSKMDTMPINHI